MSARGEPRGREEPVYVNGQPPPRCPPSPQPPQRMLSTARAAPRLPGRLPRRRVLCGAAERAQGRPEAALAELCFPQGTGTARPPRVRRGRGGSAPVCEGVTGRARQVLCALGPGTDVAGLASGVTALTPTHTVCSLGRIEAEQQHAPGRPQEEAMAWSCAPWVLLVAVLGCESSDPARWRLFVQMLGARPKTY